jgi:tripartite ATP-independent transporter DctP family solute receptor
MKIITRRAIVGSAASVAALCIAAPRMARAAEFTMKWGHAMAASHPINTRGEEAIESIRRETNGRLDLRVFPDNQLGGDNDMTSQVRAGALDFYTAAATSAGTIVPLAGIVNTAFAFPDDKQAWAALDGDLVKVVIAAFARLNFHVFDKMWANGFRQITTATKVITSPEDLKNFKIRVPTSPMLLSLFKSLGASPVSMNVSELYTALQTKIVDGQENPLSIIATRNFNEVQKYCATTNHVWDNFVQVVNANSWKSLPADVQAIVTKNFDAAVMKQRADVEALNSSLQKTLEAKGLAFNKPDPVPFRDALRKAGYYAQWQKTYGEQAWAALEKYSGKLA